MPESRLTSLFRAKRELVRACLALLPQPLGNAISMIERELAGAVRLVADECWQRRRAQRLSPDGKAAPPKTLRTIDIG